MNNQLKNIIDQYKNSQLKVRNKSFSAETILDEFIGLSSFTNVNFLDLNLTNVDFDSSFFKECLFKNCIFESTSLQDAEFENCNLINCQIKNCNLTRVDFTETTFNKCCFEKVEKGCLVKSWFESCNFLATNFKGFEGMSLIQAAVVDSKFSKFNKSIEFKGEFFLTDILQSGNVIDEMVIE